MSEVGEGAPIISSSTSVRGEIRPAEGNRFPFKDYVDPHIPTFSIVKFPEENMESGNFQRSRFKIRKPTIHHGRSFEVVLSERGPGVIWSDESGGSIFGAVNIKGNNLEDPKVERDRYSPSGFKVMGLQEGYALGRIAHVSEELRKAGIDTEKPEVIIQPEELIIDGRTVPMDEFKRILLEKTREDIPKRRYGLFDGEDVKLKPEQLPQIEAYLKNNEFYFTVRGLQVTERIRDLEAVQTEEQFGEVMGRVFTFINAREKIEAQRQNRQLRVLSPDSETDLEYYFTDYFPNRVATNIAKMHKLGLTHGFLTGHNVSLAGSIYDLDSVYGRAVGDNRDPDFKDDLNEFQRDAYKIFYPRGRDSNFFSRTYGERFGPKFFQAFTERYLDISTQEVTTAPFLEDYHQLMIRGMEDARSQGLGSQTMLAELEKAERENPNFLIDDFRSFVRTRIENNYWEFFHTWEPALFREGVREGIESSFDKVLDQRVAQLDITDQMQQELRTQTVEAAKELDKVPSAV